jgi:uncharacterized protein YbjT (DUF2867 family)
MASITCAASPARPTRLPPKVRHVSLTLSLSLTPSELKKLGVEVVEANLDDVKSLEKAFNGAYGVFGVTNFWEHLYG